MPLYNNCHLLNSNTYFCFSSLPLSENDTSLWHLYILALIEVESVRGWIKYYPVPSSLKIFLLLSFKCFLISCKVYLDDCFELDTFLWFCIKSINILIHVSSATQRTSCLGENVHFRTTINICFGLAFLLLGEKKLAYNTHLNSKGWSSSCYWNSSSNYIWELCRKCRCLCVTTCICICIY